LEKAAKSKESDNPLFESYSQLAQGLIGELSGACLLDSQWRVRGSTGRIVVPLVKKWVDELGWSGTLARQPAAKTLTPGEWITAIPLEQSDTTLLGAFCVQQSLSNLTTYPARYAADLARRLKPLLDCIYRELAASIPVRERVQTMTERTAELEWLFKVTSHIKGGMHDRYAIKELLAAATERLTSAMGVCAIPDKRICIEYMPDAVAAPNSGWSGPHALRGVWAQTSQHLLNWALRRNTPLVINSAGRNGDKIPRCKILSVPVVRDSGKVIGVLAFINPPFAPDYVSRHVYLAKHLGLQAASVVDTQFDLMTGLYTQGALDQIYGGLADDSDGSACSLAYLDVDHMHVVNELHGFEIGNELIVRIADLLSPPLVPSTALAARLSGDRFAIVLPNCDARAAHGIAQAIQKAIMNLKIGPADNPVEASVSCGVADIVAMPQRLDRSIAAAEIACKTAKSRGRNRVELYASDDRSMMRRHKDAIAVGRLRAALKADRLLLYAQCVRPFKNPSQGGAYEILVRVRDENGDVAPLGELVHAAQRLHLLTSIDRWVTQRALQLLAPYGGMLRSRGIGWLIPVAGQSFADGAFVTRFVDQLKAAALPEGCITVEFTEQSATEGLVHAKEMIRRLKECGCRFALNEFNMGKDSLMHIRNLDITRVKIHSSVTLAAVRSIVEFARVLSIETIVDSVDSDELVKALRGLGVGYMQGAAIGKPEPFEELLRGLGADESRRQERLRLELG
jgi:diguanylate cyclase (GGDEF)-like protein